MMVDTYVLCEVGCWSEAMQGFSFGNLLGIKNISGYEVDVRNIMLTPLMGFDTTVDMRPQTLYRISALESGDVLAPLKNDTGSGSLPSQVLARTHGVITTAGVLRQFGVLFGQRAEVSSVIYAGRVPGVGVGSPVVQTFARTADQRVVLREGEGFAWQQLQAPVPRTQEAVFVVRNASSGATYTWRVPDTPVAEQDNMFALFNGSGSGVVLELVSAEICDVGMQGYINQTPWGSELLNELNGIRVIKGYDLVDGQVVTPHKRDTNSIALPTGITCHRGGFVAVEGESRAQANYEWTSGGFIGQDLIAQQRLGLIRGLAKDYQERWSLGSTDFPHRWEGVAQDLLRNSSNLEFPGVVLRRNEVLSVASWYRSIHSAANNYLNPSYTESPNTGGKFNITIEFNVAVGQGDLLGYAPTAVNVPIIS